MVLVVMEVVLVVVVVEAVIMTIKLFIRENKAKGISSFLTELPRRFRLARPHRPGRSARGPREAGSVAGHKAGSHEDITMHEGRRETTSKTQRPACKRP